MEHQGVPLVQLGVGISGSLGLASMEKDSVSHCRRPAIVEEGRVLAESPEGLGSELVSKRLFHGDAIGKLGAHIMQQEVGIGVDLADASVEACGVAAGAAKPQEAALSLADARA